MTPQKRKNKVMRVLRSCITGVFLLSLKKPLNLVHPKISLYVTVLVPSKPGNIKIILQPLIGLYTQAAL